MTSYIEVFDGGKWIDTGSLEILDSKPPGPDGGVSRPTRLLQALRLRWQIWLEDNLPHQDDLRMVSSDGYWLSPLSGEPIPTVPVIDGLIDHRVIDAMAHYLAGIEGSDPRDFGATVGVSINAERSRKYESAQRAAKVQQNVTRQIPALPNWNVGIFYQAVEEVGGDFIETVRLPGNRLLVCLGDVSGHGVQGALLAAGASHFLRGLAFHHDDLIQLCSAFYDGIVNDFLPGDFLTCWICLVDLSDNSYECISLGHTQPLVMNPTESPPTSRTAGKGGALGLLKKEHFLASLTIETGQWNPGQTFVVWSDGLEEHGPSLNDQFGSEGVIASVVESQYNDPQELTDFLASQCLAYAGRPFADDVTIIAIQRADD